MQSVPLRFRARKPKEIDFEPATLGDHVKKRRLILGITAKEAARKLGVTAWTVRHWETNQTQPPVRGIHTIVRFLGYDPFPEPKSISERLLAKRRAMGWSIRAAAREFGVDPGTWGDWERGSVILYRAHRALVARLLGLQEGEVEQVMAASWAWSHE